MKIPRKTATVRVHTTEPYGVPLSKERVAIYNSGLVPIDRYERDRRLIEQVGAESLRIDLGWGAPWMPRRTEVVRREPGGQLSYRFEETDALARLIASTGTRPYWSYCYVPAAARRRGQSWMGMAEDDTVWVDTVRAYVASMSERGVEVGYHEVYNEPDLRDERTGAPHFYDGDLDDYLALYRATSRAIREADPAAIVGGPSLAAASVNAHWLTSFLEMVQQEGLPLDFLSFHHYGHFSVENTIRIVDEVLGGFEGFEHLELHLNEYNAFVIDYPRGGLQDTYYLASAFAAEIPRLLSHRAITRTHWAQFMDSGDGNFSGMIDIDGVPKPVYAVYDFYQGMPVTQVRTTVDGPRGVGALAGATHDAARSIIWNRSQHKLAVTLEVDIDAAGSVTIVDSAEIRTLPTGPGGRTEIALEAGAVALVHMGDPIGQRPRRRCKTIYERAAPGESGWADVDESTGTIRLHTGAGQTTRRVILDTTDDALREAAWRVTVEGPSAEPTGSIGLTVEDDHGASTRLIQGDADTPTPPAPSRPRRVGTTRLSFTFDDLPRGTRLTLIPSEGA